MARVSGPVAVLSKVQSVVDIASHYQQCLLRGGDEDPPTPPDLSPYLSSLPFVPSSISGQQRQQLTKAGVALWNTCSKLRRDDEQKTRKAHRARGRVLAYLLLKSAVKKQRTFDDDMKIFEQALKAGKDCLEVGVLDLASIVLESGAAQQQDLDTSGAINTPAQKSKWIPLASEYLLTRVVMAWKQERLDLADHFLKSIDTASVVSNDSEYLERLTDALYEIGHSEFEAGRAIVAVHWLGSASKLLANAGCDNNCDDSVNLRLNVDHAYVRALLATSDPGACAEAYDVLQRLRKDHGHLLAVMLLRLEVLSLEPTSNAESYFSELTAITRSMHLLETNHNIVLHHLHRLKDIDRGLAATALKQYIIQRLLPENDCPYTESCVVMLIWIVACASDGEQQFCAQKVKAWLDDISSAWDKRLSEEACHGALVLLWKQVERFAHQQACAENIAWCRLMLHRIFSASDEQNIAKVHRKLIECHIAGSNFDAATTVLEQMSPTAQQHPITHYLVFRIAVRTGPDEFVQKAFNAIVRESASEHGLLLAAISETMISGTKRQGAIVLHRVLDKYWTQSRPGIDIQALLRCITRLLISVLADEEYADLEMSTRLCACLKAACELYSRRDSTELRLGNRADECRWFFTQGYNVVLQNLSKLPAKDAIDMLHYMGEIHDTVRQLQPHEATSERHEMRRLDVLYLQVILYITEARSVTEATRIGDIPCTSYARRTPLQQDQIHRLLYQHLFNKASDIQRISKEVRDRGGSAEFAEKAVQIQYMVLPYQFEALLQLTEPGGCCDEVSLLQVIQQAQQLGAPLKTFSLMADMVLSAATASAPNKEVNNPSQLPRSTAVALLRHIITVVRQYDGYSIDQASRWIRCIVQLVLESMRADDDGKSLQHFELLEQVVTQAIVLARSSQDPVIRGDLPRGNRSDRLATVTAMAAVTAPPHDPDEIHLQYPSDELEWLATTLFNLAIDLYVSNRTMPAKELARRSVEVADVLAAGVDHDQGSLANVLRERCGRLDWM